MQKQFDNTPFTPFFRFVTVTELLVVGLVSGGLFFLPDIAKADVSSDANYAWPLRYTWINHR